MKVKELIEKLKEMDQDLPVRVMVDDTRYQEFPDGDTYKETNYIFSDSVLKIVDDQDLDEKSKFATIYGKLSEVLSV